MVEEIELKILNINTKEIEKKLIKLGAKKIPQRLVVEKHFDFKDNKITNKGDLLRLRKIGDKAEICHKSTKQKDSNFKINEEIEANVDNFKVVEKILLNIGLIVKKHREKKRTSFKLNNLHIEIDKYPEIPPYLEIEGPKKEILNLLNKLNFSLKQTTSDFSSKVIKSYGKNSNFLKF
ncbi:MAG: class IV adenylate cyclase [archaeon]